MKNATRIAVAAALTGGLVAVGTVGITPAQAAPKNAGAACVQAGIGFLKANDLLQAAAKKQIDYSTLANPETGPIFTTLPEGSFLSLGQVVKLHKSNPALFDWC